MSRTLNHITGGKWKLWWHMHGRQFWYNVAMLTVFALYCVASELEHREHLDMERARADDHQSRAMQCEQGGKLPKTVFIIESASTYEAQDKLAGIAGAVDGLRAKLWKGGK
jgi:hypothetical protein